MGASWGGNMANHRKEQKASHRQVEALRLIGKLLTFFGLLASALGVLGSFLEPLSHLPSSALRLTVGILLIYSGDVSRHLSLALRALPEGHALNRIDMGREFVTSRRGIFLLVAIGISFLVWLLRTVAA